MTQAEPTRIGIDSYLDWVANEGLPVHAGLAIDCFAVEETAPWARAGARGAVLHLDGRGDFCNMLLLEGAAGRRNDPAAPPLRRSHLRLGRQRQHASRASERRKTQLRVGTGQSVRHPAQCRSSGTSMRAD